MHRDIVRVIKSTSCYKLLQSDYFYFKEQDIILPTNGENEFGII